MSFQSTLISRLERAHTSFTAASKNIPDTFSIKLPFLDNFKIATVVFCMLLHYCSFMSIHKHVCCFFQISFPEHNFGQATVCQPQQYFRFQESLLFYPSYPDLSFFCIWHLLNLWVVELFKWEYLHASEMVFFPIFKHQIHPDVNPFFKNCHARF